MFVLYVLFFWVILLLFFFYFFFFQAEDGIRDKLVTGVQTCALPICFHRLVIWRETTLDRKLWAHAPEEVDRCSGLGECAGDGQNRGARRHRDERTRAPAQRVHTSQGHRKHLERRGNAHPRRCSHATSCATHDQQQQEV